jgi:hypothetical protein
LAPIGYYSQITIPDPTADNHAATKGYVDDTFSGVTLLTGAYLSGVIPSGSTTAVVQHDLGTKDLAVSVWEVSSGLLVGVPVETKDGSGTLSDNHVRFTFNTAPTGGQYRYAIFAGAPLSAHLVPVPPASLADAATIATDASLGTHFILGAMAGDRTLGAPTNPTEGQRVLWEITASGAPRSLTLTTSGSRSFKLTAAAPDATIAIASGETAVIGAVYNATRDRFIVLAATVTVA